MPTPIDEVMKQFEEEFGHLACDDRLSKCNCTPEEHELRSSIPVIKDFIRTAFKQYGNKIYQIAWAEGRRAERNISASEHPEWEGKQTVC